MLYLADTNILLRMAEPAHAMHMSTLDALAVLRRRGDDGCIIPQNVIEFWNVATRPQQYNGLGFTQSQARAEVAKIEHLFQLLLDAPAIYVEWKSLVMMHAVAGKQVHDARIVAAMGVHGIRDLLTFNTGDFKRYSAIRAVDPASLIP